MLSFIIWDVDPEAFNLFGREIRWYGILWAVGVFLTSWIVQGMYKHENLPEKWFDKLFLYVFLGLIAGARLGHCLFYNPGHYLSNPLEILKVWEGGLASHGGAIGMTIAVCLYSLYVTQQKFNWKHAGISAAVAAVVGAISYFAYINSGLANTTDPLNIRDFLIMASLIGICVSFIYTTRDTTVRTLDRLIVGVAIGATFIRLGNLMNSEIYGGATSLPWGFNFVRDRMWHEPLSAGGGGELPCHPTQIYEALVYLALFGLGLYLYYKTNAKDKKGLILGLLLIGIFFSRFLIEYLKFVQEPFELLMRDTIGIDMGQLLSLPFVVWGICLVWNALKNKEEKITTLPVNNNKNVKTNSTKR